MAWRSLDWDLIFVPLALVISLLYNLWLWHMVKRNPNRTTLGICTAGQCVWIAEIVKDNDKKNILAVQGLRNNLMSSSLVATSSFLICCGLLAFTSTISDKQDLVLESLNQLEVSHKCAVLLLSFMSVFFFQTISITFLNQVSIVVNTLILEECTVTADQLSKQLEKGILMSTVGNRLFFSVMPLVLWIYSPVLVFASSVGVIIVLYNTDLVLVESTKPVADQSTIDVEAAHRL